jgi:hypothetical protein
MPAENPVFYQEPDEILDIPEVNIAILRHGQGENQVNDEIISDKDSRLTPQGRIQSRRTNRRNLCFYS